jgi:hypothetical protein
MSYFYSLKKKTGKFGVTKIILWGQWGMTVPGLSHENREELDP